MERRKGETFKIVLPGLIEYELRVEENDRSGCRDCFWCWKRGRDERCVRTALEAKISGPCVFDDDEGTTHTTFFRKIGKRQVGEDEERLRNELLEIYKVDKSKALSILEYAKRTFDDFDET